MSPGNITMTLREGGKAFSKASMPIALDKAIKNQENAQSAY